MNIACPSCGAPMDISTSQGVEVDVCASCNALWLDRGEFDSLVGLRFAGGEVELLFELTAFPALNPRVCPRDQTNMHTVFFLDLELDRCPTCAGVLLDQGDRAELRARTTRERDIKTVQAKQLPSFSETEELTLDLKTRPPLRQDVTCASCGHVVKETQCMKRLGEYWCENCVVAGDYPGGYGPTISSRKIAAAESLTNASAKLNQAKQAQRVNSIRRNAPRTLRGGRRLQPEEYDQFVDSVRQTANKIVGLFRKDK